MTPDAAFVARILIAEEGSDELLFRATGIVVAPRYVLTCAHTVLGIEPETFAGSSDDNDALLPASVTVSVTSSSGQEIRRKGVVVSYDVPDLALVRLDRPIPEIRPLRFASGVTSISESAFFQIRSFIAGYSRTAPGTLLNRAIEGRVSSTRSFGNQQLHSLQIVGGTPLGMSGSPLLAQVNGDWVCLAVAYLGRDGSPTSRLMPSDTVANFLARNNVACSPLVDISPIMHDTLGAFLQKQRANRGLTQRDVAHALEIGEETLRQWEADTNRPVLEYRKKLFEQLAQGDTDAGEEWRRLTEELNRAGMPVDMVANLQERAQAGGVKVEALDSYRNFYLELPPSRPQFYAHSRVRIYVELPWPCHATFLNIVGLESTQRSYVCLDAMLGLPGPLPAGAMSLPTDSRPLFLAGPRRINCLAVLARKEHGFSWSKTGNDQTVPEEEVLQHVQSLAALDGDEVFVSLFEYEVLI